MNDLIRKELIIFTSQSLKQYGFRAVRMDTIAHNMKISKRTLYEIYGTKDNLISNCFISYLDRTKNMFEITKYNASDPLKYLFDISKQYINNLYKAECVFWLDITKYYPHIYHSIQKIWTDELERSLLNCKNKLLIGPDIDIKSFLHSFVCLLYSARISNLPIEMSYKSAFYMMRGILTISGVMKMDLFYDNKFC